MNGSSVYSDDSSSKKPHKKSHKKAMPSNVSAEDRSKIIANFEELQGLLESWHRSSVPTEAEKMRDLLIHVRYFLTASPDTNTDRDIEKYKFLAETVQIFQDKYQQSSGEVVIPQGCLSIDSASTTPLSISIVASERLPMESGASSKTGSDDQGNAVDYFYKLEEIKKLFVTFLPSISSSESEKIIDLLCYVKRFLKDGGDTNSANVTEQFASLDGTINKFLIKHLKPGGADLPRKTTPGFKEPPRSGVGRGDVTSNDFMSNDDLISKTDCGKVEHRANVMNSDLLPTKTGDFDLHKVLTAIYDLKVELKEYLSNSDVGKKSLRVLDGIAEDIEKNSEEIAALRVMVSKLATKEELRTGFSDLLDASRKTSTEIQNFKIRFDQFDAFLNQFELLQKKSNDEIGRLHTRIDAKIDLTDVDRIFEFRNDLEPHVHASLIRSVSKQVMPALEDLKAVIHGDEGGLTKAITSLEDQCNKAGLIPTNKLF